METIEQALAHHGVKGQKWGVRRDRTPTSVLLKETPGKRVKAEGGKNQSAHDDAKRAATHKQLAKKSTVDSLSDKELQALVNRMNLEQQYSKLSKSGPGTKLVKSILGDQGSQSLKDASKNKRLAVTLAKAASLAL